MQTESWKIISDREVTEARVTREGGRLLIDTDDLEAATGWNLKPEGFCRGEICVPIPAGSSPVTAEGVDLGGMAELLGRPLVSDTDERVACLGEAAQHRAESLRSLQAPDFHLPDLHGKMHALSDHRGKKVMIAAWASW